MASNSFRGFGAIPQSDSMLANMPGITPLSKQYTDASNNHWPSSNTFMGFAAVTNQSSYRLQIFTRRNATNNFDKIPNLSTAPTTLPYCIDFSKDGKFMAVGITGTPYIYIYKREGDTFTRQSNPSTLPTGVAQSVAFSQDGKYLGCVHAGSPRMTVYRRSGDTFTKISNPVSLPDGTTPVSCAFSPDGNYFAIGTNASPYVNVYKIDSTTDTFTKLSIPTNTAGATVNNLTFSPDSVHLMYAGGSSPSYGGYKITAGDTFTLLSTGSFVGATPATVSNDVSFSPDGVYLAIAASSELVIVKRSGDTFTRMATQPTQPPSAVNIVKFSPDGNYLLVGATNIPLAIYSRSGDTFTSITSSTNPQDFQDDVTGVVTVIVGLTWLVTP